MMDVTPGTDSQALTVMLPCEPPSHRSLRREIMQSSWSRGALVALVFVLGLLQGTRAALGDMPLADLPAVTAAPPETRRAGVSEPDALRGHFFRPDSDAGDPVAPAPEPLDPSRGETPRLRLPERGLLRRRALG
jgi:hypothetical protein